MFDMVLYSFMIFLSEIIFFFVFGDDGVGGGGSVVDNGILLKCVMGCLCFFFKGLDMREDRVGRWFCKGFFIRMFWRVRNGGNEEMYGG